MLLCPGLPRKLQKQYFRKAIHYRGNGHDVDRSRLARYCKGGLDEANGGKTNKKRCDVRISQGKSAIDL